jgi:hypothetical protein
LTEDLSPADEPLSRKSRAAAFCLPLAAALAALAVSWKCWIDPLVDSGREMDVPWRLAQGERLYRDITYYYGPLGAWTNALALRLFGHRWLVLELVCAALSAVLFFLLFRLTRRAGGPLAATAATALSAALCMGAPHGGAFIFPYASSGLFALAGGLLALDAATSRPRRPFLSALGIGIALASRFEVGATAAVVLALAGLRSESREEGRADLAAVALGVLLGGNAYLAAFVGIPWRQWLAVGPFGPLLAMPVEWRSLYLRVSGFEEPLRTARSLAIGLLLDGVLLGLAAWAPVRGRRAWSYLAALASLLFASAFLGSRDHIATSDLPPILAILPLLAVGAAVARLRRPLAGRDRARFLLFAWSAALAGRVLCGLAVGPRMSAYATLPLPGLLATAAVLGFDLLAPRLAAPPVFRLRLAALFAVFGVLFLYRLERADHHGRRVEIETAAGALRLKAREATTIRETLDYLDRHGREGDTLTAFPESGFFNFVLGLRSPLRQDLIVPGVLNVGAEDAAVRQLDAAGPRYVLLCNRPTPEYGPVAFGRDYAARLWSEVDGQYRRAGSFGGARPDAPVGDQRFFIRLYERRSGAGAPAQLPSTGPRRRPAPLPLLSQRLP